MLGRTITQLAVSSMVLLLAFHAHGQLAKNDFCPNAVSLRMGCPVGEGEALETPFLEAIRQRNIPLVKQLIVEGNNANYIDSRGLSPLLMVATGDFELIDILLNAGAEVNGEAKYGATALIASTQCSAAVKRFLDAGADPNKRNANRFTPLMSAVRSRNIQSVKYLVEAGADVYAVDVENMTAVLYAFQNSDLETIRYFTNEFENKRLFTESVLDKAMYFAVLNSQLPLVEFLFSKGAKVEGFDGKSTPLTIAVQKHNAEIVKLLLKSGAKVNHDNGFSPIYYAALKGETENVRLLLNAKAIVDEPRRSNYWTPLIEAARNDHVEVMKLLLGAGADVNRRAYDGKTALMYAAWTEKYAAVKYLIERSRCKYDR